MKKRKTGYIVYAILTILLFFAGILGDYALKWAVAQFGKVPFDQIVFHLKVPLAGTDSNILSEFITGFLRKSLVYVIGVILVITAGTVFFYRAKDVITFTFIKFKIKLQKLLKWLTILGGAALLITDIVRAFDFFSLGEYIKNISKSTQIYEEYYVDAGEAGITFPEDKKNLIYIFLESMETTYADDANGGAWGETNLIPNLTELAYENEDFSTGVLGGGYNTTGATWTVGAMVAETAGIPLSIPVDVNSYGKYSSFLPGATTLGDILADEGYNQMLMIGSASSFGGRSNYFSQHGNYDIFDLYTARKEGFIPSDYKVFWGYEDIKLFEFAKTKITELASQDEPFNFTMLTVDTHFPNGYRCEECGFEYSTQMQNAIVCSDTQVAKFVEWIKEQDFYEDTVIVIAGDHVNMASAIEKAVGEDYERKVYFTVINSDTTRGTDTDRVFTTMDIFPTTLASLGCEIEGDRLGLGTNLYSDTQTLVEIMGIDALNVEMGSSSGFYSDNILEK